MAMTEKYRSNYKPAYVLLREVKGVFIPAQSAVQGFQEMEIQLCSEL